MIISASGENRVIVKTRDGVWFPKNKCLFRKSSTQTQEKEVSLFCGHKDSGFKYDIEFKKIFNEKQKRKITDEKQLKYSMFQFMTYFN